MSTNEGLPEFTTIFNVRDLGGYRAETGNTRYRRFLRSGDTMFLSEEDLQALLDYGVSRVVDLRLPIERPELTSPFVHRDDVAWICATFSDERTLNPDFTSGQGIVELIVEGYQQILADKRAVARMMSFMADAQKDDCVLFHCAGGMDRTGLVSYLLLANAGVGRDDIVRDYVCAFGAPHEIDALITRVSSSCPKPEHDGIEARIAIMNELSRWMGQTYGSVRAYLASCGLSQDRINALAAHLLL